MVFTTLDTLQLKKIDDHENIYSVNPLYLIIAHASGYIERSSTEEKGVKNIWFLILQMKIKSYLKIQ